MRWPVTRHTPVVGLVFVVSYLAFGSYETGLEFAALWFAMATVRWMVWGVET